MDFALDAQAQAIFDTAFTFGQEQLAPQALTWEAAGTIPRSVLREAGNLGFGGLSVPEDLGGAGLTRLESTLVFEALAMADPSVSAFVSIHNMCALLVAGYARAELRTALLPKLISLEAVASYCLTEPGSGSDAAALRTKAEKTETGYRLDGSKAFISGGGYSDVYLVMCRTGGEGPKGISTVLVPSGTQGLSFGAQEQKMGWKAQPTCQVQFDACHVPADHLLGEEGQGFRYALEGLDGGRLSIAACSLGGAQAAFDRALNYVGERKAFGSTLDSLQTVQFTLADMATRLEAARIFLRQAAWAYDQRQPDAKRRCAMAKRFVTDTASQVADQALQLLGGYGYLTDYGIEKLVRDLRVHRILEGTNEIMQLIIARDLLKERG